MFAFSSQAQHSRLGKTLTCELGEGSSICGPSVATPMMAINHLTTLDLTLHLHLEQIR
jgi:hypothetical protein